MFTKRTVRIWRQKVEREWSQLDEEARLTYTTPPMSETISTKKRIADAKNDSPRKRANRESQSIELNGDSANQRELAMGTRFDLRDTPSTTHSPGLKMDLINDLRRVRPEINCAELANADMPEQVSKLVERLIVGLGMKSIPLGLKSRMEGADRCCSMRIPPSAYDDSPWKTVELEALWNLVNEVHRDGRICGQYGVDKNSWGDKVVRPLLRAAVQDHKKTIMDVENIQDQGIHKSLIPISESITQFHPTVDYAWVFSIKNSAVGPIYDKLSIRGRYDLSHMTDPFTKRCCTFCGLKVKASDSSTGSSLGELSMWLAAGLRKTLDLYDAASEREYEDETEAEAMSENRGKQPLTIMPLVGWTVMGHEWSTYISWLEGNQESPTQVRGPLPLGSLRTDSYEGIFRVLQLLQRVEEYAREVHWPWLHKNILEPLVNNK